MSKDDVPRIKSALAKAIGDRDKNNIYQLMQNLSYSEHISVLIHNAKDRSLHALYNDFVIDTQKLDYNSSILGQVFYKKEPKIYRHLMSEKIFNPQIDNPYNSMLKSQIVLPVLDKRELIGIIRLSKIVGSSRVYTREILDELKALMPTFCELIYAFYNTRVKQKSIKIERCIVEEESFPIQEKMQNVSKMLDELYQEIPNKKIKALLEQNLKNMKSIEGEFREMMLKKAASGSKIGAKRKVNILIADDIKLNASILEALLKDVEHNICIASDGDIALRKMAQLHAMNRSVDILFLDHHMPNMLGSEVVEALHKNIKRYTKNKMHIVSITNDPKAIESKRKLYDFHIRKPFMKDEIQKVVESIKKLGFAMH